MVAQVLVGMLCAHLLCFAVMFLLISQRLQSKKMGRKSIIKVSNKYFSDAELNLLSVVAPNVSLCIIKDFEVIE